MLTLVGLNFSICRCDLADHCENIGHSLQSKSWGEFK